MRITKRSLESALQSYNFSAKYATLTALLPAVDRYSADSFSHYTTIASLPGGAATRKKEVLARVACKDLGLLLAERQGFEPITLTAYMSATLLSKFQIGNETVTIFNR